MNTEPLPEKGRLATASYPRFALFCALGAVGAALCALMCSESALAQVVGQEYQGIAGTNKNLHEAAHLAMKGGGICIIGAALVIPAVAIL